MQKNRKKLLTGFDLSDNIIKSPRESWKSGQDNKGYQIKIFVSVISANEILKSGKDRGY